MAVARTLFAPAHHLATTAQAQRHFQALGMLVQHPQIELHQVPANDCVGVMPCQPCVEALEQLAAAVAIVEREIDSITRAIGRAEHVHLALAATFQGNGVQVAVCIGLDIQRHQLEPWAVSGRGFHLRLEQRPVAAGRAAEGHRCGNEALHQVAFRRADISLEDVDTGLAQAGFQVHQLAMLATVQAQYRPLLEIAQRQCTQLDIGLATQQCLDLLPLCGRHKGH
ncbi:hypothetical protein D3C76_347570 [compost metagenome]